MSEIKFGRSETWKDYRGKHTYAPVFRGRKQIGTVGADGDPVMHYCYEGWDDGRMIALAFNLNEAKRRLREILEGGGNASNI